MRPAHDQSDLRGDREALAINSHVLDLGEYRRRLVEWGPNHFRVFPWRETRDPYRVLMAEFMLLRTNAPQVAPVYVRFLDRYPTLSDLGRAGRTEVREILHPLGLVWRADYVFETAHEILKDHEGEVPRDRIGLLSLPGVSQYIAAAVRCFAFGEVEGLIDTNTVRVVSRLFGLEMKPHTRRSKAMREAMPRLADPAHPRVYNFALLDLAAQVCTARISPDCPSCPLLRLCLTGRRLTSLSPPTT